MTWMVTGGAGYIGGHIIRAFRAAGIRAVVYDDLSTGLIGRVPTEVPLINASVLDTQSLIAALREHEIRGVIHLAAKKSVPESFDRPLYYYEQNVQGFVSLLNAAQSVGVDRLVFSSSCSARIHRRAGWVVTAECPSEQRRCGLSRARIVNTEGHPLDATLSWGFSGSRAVR